MKEEYIVIRLQDMCDLEDRYEYPLYVVKKEKDIYPKLRDLEIYCNSAFNGLNEIEEYIKNNFQKVKFETYTIEID